MPADVAPASDAAAPEKVLLRRFNIDMKGNVVLSEITVNAEGKRAARKTPVPLEDEH